MKVSESLSAISAYPVPYRTLSVFMTRRGLDAGAEADADVICSDAYRLARADVLWWLSKAPNITQGGQSYSFTEEERTSMRAEALGEYNTLEETKKARYGYKGSRL